MQRDGAPHLIPVCDERVAGKVQHGTLASLGDMDAGRVGKETPVPTSHKHVYTGFRNGGTKLQHIVTQAEGLPYVEIRTVSDRHGEGIHSLPHHSGRLDPSQVQRQEARAVRPVLLYAAGKDQGRAERPCRSLSRFRTHIPTPAAVRWAGRRGGRRGPLSARTRGRHRWCRFRNPPRLRLRPQG